MVANEGSDLRNILALKSAITKTQLTKERQSNL
jgi:hypothetical protein